ncbi:MAG: hypothetical protein AB1671_29185, partial [Thermodesulfobacteriota bacterium]
QQLPVWPGTAMVLRHSTKLRRHDVGNINSLTHSHLVNPIACGGKSLRRYVPRRARQRRRVLVTATLWLIAACAAAGLVVARNPALIPGAPEFLERAMVVRDLLCLRRTLQVTARSAEFWGPDLLIVDMEIRNHSPVVILCQDLRLVDRRGQVFLPSSTSVYYVNRQESLWMRQVNPGRSVSGKFAFIVPDGTFGLACAIETEIGVIRLSPIREISRRKM